MKVFTVIGGCAGKTELVRRLVAALKARGLRVSTIKRVPDTLDLERPGSGTWSHRQAGAEEVMLASATRYAILRETSAEDDEPDVDALLARLADVDLVLLEGFKLTFYPKLELVQPGHDRRLFALDDPTVVAVTAEQPLDCPAPWLPLADIAALADCVLANAVLPGQEDARRRFDPDVSVLRNRELPGSAGEAAAV
jgi:molybdopterin-guanine dinucleotide biosynthesis protein MobB